MPNKHDCKLCQRTFRCRSAQRRHIRTSHLKKSTFHCRECFYFSNRRDTCVRHYKTCHSELEYDKLQVYEVKTADSLPFANQQQPNTSRDAKQVLTYKYKEQNGQIRIKGKIKKPEFTLTPIKTGEKTGLQKIAKVSTRRESPLSDDVVGRPTATSGTTTTPLDMLEATVKDQDEGAITSKASTSISRSHWEDLLQSHGGSKNMFAARDHLADEQEALNLSAYSLNTHNSWSTDTCDQKIAQFYIEHPPALVVAGDRWLRADLPIPIYVPPPHQGSCPGGPTPGQHRTFCRT